VLKHFQRLKERMTKSRSRERKLLTELTVQSRTALDALKHRQDEVGRPPPTSSFGSGCKVVLSLLVSGTEPAHGI
jgi:predicted lactoylglutathione lyase